MRGTVRKKFQPKLENQKDKEELNDPQEVVIKYWVDSGKDADDHPSAIKVEATI